MKTMGDTKEAAAIYERVVAGCTARLGPMHVNTLSVQMNLANALCSGGDVEAAMYERCRGLYDLVIEGRTQALGAAHEQTLAAQANLADLLRDQRKLTEARALCELVVDGYNANPDIGPSHINTLFAQKNLANILMELPGEQGKAQHLLELVIAKYTAQLGATHLQTLGVKCSLADLLSAPQEVDADTLCPTGH
jgi:hypothetical protein